jgi:hypothetical protein
MQWKGRPVRIPWMPVLVLGALLLVVTGIRGQEDARALSGAPGDGPGPSGEEQDEGAPAIQPDAVSSFQTRTYRIRPRKLWAGLLRTLEESGYPPEEVNEDERRVKTSFVDFTSKDYSEEVAEAAPRLTPDYQVLQMNKVRAGKVSIEGVVAHERHGAALSLRARILVQGFDRRRRIIVLADRRSSGIIESDFLQHLEETLDLERLEQP